MKTCSKCRQLLPLEQFSLTKDKRLTSPRPKSECKACSSARANAWRKTHPDRAAVNQRAHAKGERAQEWLRRPEVRARRNAVVRAWCKANPHRVNFHTSKRRAAQLQALAGWADLDLIGDLYQYASIMRAAGVDCHVDHIAPLQGRNVCGLHTHDNLTVLLAEDNLSKSNRHA